MFGLDLRTLRKLWTLFLFVLAILVVYWIGRTLVVFTLAIFLAHLLGPIAERIEKMIPDRILGRTASLAIVYLLMIAAITAALVPLVGLVASQATSLAGTLPAQLDEDPIAKLRLPVWLEPAREKLSLVLRDHLSDFDEKLIPMLQDVGSNVAGLLGSVLAMILIPILSFFFLKDSSDIHDSLVDLFPGEHRDLVEDILADLHNLLESYIRALMLLALCVLGSYTAFLYLVGVRYAILLAAVAAALEIIPIVGPLVGSVAIVLVALLTGFPHIWWLVVFLILFRLVQDYVISPQLMSAGVEVHPLLVLFGVLAGEQIAGISGMFFSVPVMAALRILIMRMRRSKISEDVNVSVILE
jgi:predicted PurR-regulated permease PerM